MATAVPEAEEAAGGAAEEEESKSAAIPAAVAGALTGVGAGALASQLTGDKEAAAPVDEFESAAAAGAEVRAQLRSCYAVRMQCPAAGLTPPGRPPVPCIMACG